MATANGDTTQAHSRQLASEKYQNLPGVKVTYEDGNLYTANQRLSANTQSILLIGSAVDGPVGVPVSVSQLGIRQAEKLFGGMIDRVTKEPLQASLVKGMYEAVKAGNEDVRLLRMDGKSAQTVLKAKDIARAMEQFLDYAAGNTSFGMDIKVPAGGKFVGINKVEEVAKDGTSHVLNSNTVIDYVDPTAGAEKVYFFPNKIRPGSSVKISFDYETRNYTTVPKADSAGKPDYTDPDYTLTRDTQITHYFYSARKNWSDQLQSGHIPVVTVKDSAGVVYTIPSMTPTGDFIYRVGKGQSKDPLKDAWSTQDYIDGGIFFTSAYDAEVAKNTYPNITGNVKVLVEYAWFTAYGNKSDTTDAVPGQATNYGLNYTPMADQFSVYYMVGAQKTVLVEGTDYSLSLLNKKVTVNAGAAPVGAQIFANYKTSASTKQDPTVTVEGKFPGSIYGTLTDIYDTKTLRGVRVQVDLDPTDANGFEKIITIYKPEEKRLTYKDNSLVYYTKQLPRVKTLRDFVNFVNADPMNNVVVLSTDNDYGSIAVQGLLPTAAVFLGEEAPGVLKEDPTKPQGTVERYPWLGQDGSFDITKEADMQRLYETLGGKFDTDINGNPKLITQGVYQKIENYVVDIVVLLDAYANTVIDSLDDSAQGKNFATQLAQHCAVVTAKTWETIGIIGLAPSYRSDLVNVSNYVDDLTKPGSNEHYMYNEATQEWILNADGERIDVGRYINVVFGPEVLLSNDKIGNYVSSGTVVYAALISTLSAEVATTNKTIPAVGGLRYTLSEAQHDQLVGARYVTFDQKSFNGQAGLATRFVVKDGVTAALATSDYTRLSTIRITHAAVQLVRQKADPFIGLPNGLAQRNALSAEVQAGLDRLKELGVIQRFTFTIYSSVQDRVLGNAFITLELVPQFETRKFMTSVVLKAS